MTQIFFKIFIFIILSVSSIRSWSNQNEIYSSGTIPQNLLQNANAVCREYNHEFHLNNNGSATERIRIVVTVLNEQGEDFGNLVIPYDKSNKFNFITAKSYNSFGITDKKKKNPPLRDVNYTSAGSIFEDIRLKLLNFTSNVYPYTTDYEYEIVHNSLISYPQWRPIKGFNYAVEKSSYTISWPEEMSIRYREINLLPSSRSERFSKGTHSIVWQINGIEAVHPEPLSPELNEHTPGLVVAPVHFMYDGSKGSMNTWKEFGDWIYDLNKGRTTLPESRKAEIRKLVGEITDTVQAVNTLYKYMQSRTRYVSIQLGLGGFQPFPAETVDHLGYGDCKGLSNYMMALLECVQIPSIYTIIGAGYNKGIAWPDFPSVDQNNHAILCVPLSNDTLWLECTNQSIPCGYLGFATAGKRVLLITENGGVFAHTPLLERDKNMQERVSEIRISSDGGMKGNINTSYSGYQYNNVSDVAFKDYKEQELAILKEYQIPGLLINDIGYKIAGNKIPFIQETCTISSELFATRTGDRLFIPWNAFNRLSYVPPVLENRLFPVVLNFEYFDRDSLVMVLPEGYNIERLPGDRKITTDFGEYILSTIKNDNSVVFIREFRTNRGRWPKESYNLLVDFYKSVVNLDNQKVVLKRN